MRKLVFIQPGYAHYRRQLFEKLNRSYDVLFVFLYANSAYPAMDKGDATWRTICLHADRDLFWPLRLISVLLSTDFDVIVSSLPNSAQSFIAYMIAQLKRKPLVLWTVNWNFSYEYLNRASLYRSLKFKQYKFFIHRATSVVVHGYNSYKWHRKLGLQADKVYIANQSTPDLASHAIFDPFSSFTGQRRGHSILYFSRIIRRKGLDILLKAFQQLEAEQNHARLLVVGDGDFRPFCENLATQLQLRNVMFLGSVPFEKASAYYSIADLFVLPSCARAHSEAWGLVINEAMSMAKPIITTDVVGAAFDIVNNGVNGYVVKNGDVQALYDAMKRILSDENRLKTMGRNSRTIFENFNDFEKMFLGFQAAITYACDLPK